MNLLRILVDFLMCSIILFVETPTNISDYMQLRCTDNASVTCAPFHSSISLSHVIECALLLFIRSRLNAKWYASGMPVVYRVCQSIVLQTLWWILWLFKINLSFQKGILPDALNHCDTSTQERRLRFLAYAIIFLQVI